MVIRRTAAPLALALLAAACSGSGAAHSAPTTAAGGGGGATTATSPSSTAAPRPTSAPATATTTTAPVAGPACTTSALAVTVGRTGAAAGHVGTVVLFVNRAATPCVISGYPGVAALDANGAQVAEAVRSANGYLGGLAPGSPTSGPRVTLAPGATASALVEGTDVPLGNATTCPSYPALLVTPPNETHSVRLTLAGPFPGCSGLFVHPVVPGATGSN